MILLFIIWGSWLHAASLDEISSSRPWLKLLHYDEYAGGRSRIDSPIFFLSSEGSQNPRKELDATIKALEDNKLRIGEGSLLPRCAFPARARFLEKVLGRSFPRPSCEGIEHWYQEIDIGSVSLVFSTAYPDNPASMFGHTFLKFNSKKRNAHFLRDYGGSFSAVTTEDNGWDYMYKGLTGKYPGVFSVSPYYEKVAEYARFENRDLWEFRLTLDESESLFLLEHFWELYGTAHIDYYFLTENCSFILLGVIEAAKPSAYLTRTFGGLVTPHQTIMRLKEHGLLEGSPLFRPSYQRKYLARRRVTSQDALQKYRLLMDMQLDPSLISDVNVLDLSLDDLALRRASQEDSLTPLQKELEKKILQQRAKLAQRSHLIEYDAVNRPDFGHSPYYLTFGGGEQRLLLGARYGFHGMDENTSGYEPNLHIEYLAVTGAYHPQKRILTLDSFKIADVFSLNDCQSFDCQRSWRIAVKRDSHVHSASRPTKGIGSLGYARVWSSFQSWVLAGGGGAYHAEELRTRAEISYGLMWQIMPKMKLMMDANIYFEGKALQQEGRLSLGWALYQDYHLYGEFNWDDARGYDGVLYLRKYL